MGETPLPIPNRAVKPHSADGTWPSRAWESRSPPVLHRTPSRPVGRLASLNDAERAERELADYLDHEQRYGFAAFAVLLDGELVGDMGLQHLEGGDDVELLYRLSSSVWGRGLATEAGDAALEYAFSVLRLREIVAVIAEENRASQRLVAPLGFVVGEPGLYYGHRLVRHRVTPELHRRAMAARTLWPKPS